MATVNTGSKQESMDYNAEIIGYADNTHYLAALVPANSGTRELVKGGDDMPLRFRSLDEAKQWLKAQGFEAASLRMETPYDEFIGQPAEPTVTPLALKA